MIIDDSPEILAVVSVGLAQLGYHVLTALDGSDGLETTVTAQPDCIVIDVKMPKLNGIQLVQVLHGDPQTAHIPLIILTAMATDDDMLTGMFSGADQYLIKPQRPFDIHRAIQQALTVTQRDRVVWMQLFPAEEQ